MLFVFFISANINNLSANNSSNYVKNNWEFTTPKISVTFWKVKMTKKDLKTEIKKRKKYHKDLLLKYNEFFDEKYLNLISENSLILSNLRNELENN